ncbi:MAG: ABC transporter ATP-binding protein, partial [Deltaproteobacteria bacterium]|nr:ABC transporter ATP-binding protein [Deltaproteobacteria bacterium]
MQSGLGTGWWTYIKYDDKRDRPKISSRLLRRVWLYARPYRWKILGLLVTIFAITGLSLIPPLLLRDLIDNAIANRNPDRINILAIGMIGVPLLSAAIGFWQRYISATIGESLIADLRYALYDHMSQMSLRFFTHSKTGELMSRLNNDVVGAQRAVTGTFINIVTNFI